MIPEMWIESAIGWLEDDQPNAALVELRAALEERATFKVRVGGTDKEVKAFNDQEAATKALW